MPAFRRPLSRLAILLSSLCLLLTLWVVGTAIYAVAAGSFERSLPDSTRASGTVLGILAAVYVVMILPWRLPVWAVSAMARRERLELIGYWTWNVYHSRRWNPGEEWDAVESFGSNAVCDLAASDDADLGPRLVRVLNVGPIVSGVMAVAALQLAVIVELTLKGSPAYRVAVTIVLAFLAVNVYVLVISLREEVRSPRAIVRGVKTGSLYGKREMALVMLNGYDLHHVRPREQDARWMEVIAGWVAEEPTAHYSRYHLLRYLLDTDQAEALRAQRETILSIESNLREESWDVSAILVIWYAAYLLLTAEEVERIWSWVENPGLALEFASMWLAARAAALRGDRAGACDLAKAARAGYASSATKEQTYAFERDHIDRLISSLRSEEPREEAGSDQPVDPEPPDLPTP